MIGAMKLSIVIICHNRRHLLERQVEALRSLAKPDVETELIYVDNNSSDGTLEAVRAALPRIPFPSRAIAEPGPGASYARNRGIIESAGDYVLFLDDDSFPDPEWLVRIAEAVAIYSPEILCAGVYPVHILPRPAWLREDIPEMDGYLTRLDFGPETRWLTDGEVWGANMGLRRSVYDSIGGFQPELGVINGRRMAGEELDLLWRVEAAGGRCLWVAKAAVGHAMGPEKLRLAFYLRQMRDRGRGGTLLLRTYKPDLLNQRRLWRIRGIFIYLGRALLALLRGRLTLSAAHLGVACFGWGALLAFRDPPLRKPDPPQPRSASASATRP